jgi:hypothetical protein
MDNMTTQPEVSVKQKPRLRKGGRPELLPQERRRNQFTVGYTDAQLDKLEARAEAAGLTEVELIRRLSLNLDIKTIPSANRTALIELNAIGRNVNQIARKLSTGIVSGLDQAMINTWMINVQQKLNETGQKLVNGDSHGDI